MDTRAELNPAIVFGLVILAFLAAFYLPVVVEDVEGTRQLNINQTEDSTIQVYHELNATIEDINVGQDNISVTLTDTITNNETTHTIDQGVPQDFSIEGETVTVNASIINGGTAEMEYIYPVDYGWPAELKTIAQNIGLIVMGLVAFLLLGWIWTY